MQSVEIVSFVSVRLSLGLGSDSGNLLLYMQVAELYIMIFVLTYYCRYNYQLLTPYHVNTGHLVNYLLLSFSSVIVSKLATTALAYIDQLLAVLVDLIC